MADRAGAPRVVLVHFRAELQDRIDRVCAGRPGAIAGRPGLAIEVVADRTAARDRGPASGSHAPAEGMTSIRIV